MTSFSTSPPNRTISAEESRERLNAILNPPPPESYETIMGRIVCGYALNILTIGTA